MEEDIAYIISGKHVGVENKIDLYSEVSEKDLRRIPITKRNVCYICCCVIFNDEGHILLVQEAKQSCYGEWYLPAGRLEPQETIIDGARRELKEEAGLECDFSTLLCVEINHVWIRFTFTGKVTGGKLKTTAEKDKESLQARFFSLDNLPRDLRCNDILKLIKLGKDFHDQSSPHSHPNCLPVVFPHKHITHRIVIIDGQSSRQGRMHVLASTQGNTSPHIPCLFGSTLNPSNIHTFVCQILGAACSIQPFESSIFHVCGILGVEHRGIGEEADGLCITYLVSLASTSDAVVQRPAVTSDCYFWHPIQNKHIHERLSACASGQIVPIMS